MQSRIKLATRALLALSAAQISVESYTFVETPAMEKSGMHVSLRLPMLLAGNRLKV